MRYGRLRLASSVHADVSRIVKETSAPCVEANGFGLQKYSFWWQCKFEVYFCRVGPGPRVTELIPVGH